MDEKDRNNLNTTIFHRETYFFKKKTDTRACFKGIDLNESS